MKVKSLKIPVQTVDFDLDNWCRYADICNPFSEGLKLS